MSLPSVPKRRTLLYLLCASLAPLVADEVRAQDARVGQIEEVVVTARRVEESLQDTPVSVAAFSSMELEQIGASEPKDVAQYTPNMIIRSQGGSNDDYAVGIRGIAEAEPSLAIDPAVGLYVDEVYIARNAGMAFDIVDLKRIEVLRGPQGTLFGRNAIGGAVNIISEKPGGELALKAQGAAGNENYDRAAFSLDLPAVGDLAVKLSAMRASRGGEVFSAYDGNELGGSEASAYRVALRWTPTESLISDYSYTRTNRESNGQISQLTHVRPIYADPDSNLYGGPIYQQAEAFSSPERFSKLPMTRTDSGSDSNDLAGHTLIVQWQALDSLTLKSISSYREFDSFNVSEFHSFEVQDEGDVIDGRKLETSGEVSFVPAGTFVPLFIADRDNSHRQITQEFQFLGSMFDERLQYNAGLYYFEEEAFQDNPMQFLLPTALIANFAGSGSGLPTGVADAVAALAATEGTASATLLARPFQSAISNKAYAAYSNITWNVFTDFDVTLGLRYTVDERFTSIRNIFGGEVKVLGAENEWSNFNPGLTFDYRWSPEISSYFKIDTGYRAGGFNIRATTEAAFETPFDPEELTSYEFGIKSDLLDRTLRLNAAVFHYVYENRQISQFEAGSGGASSKIENAGESATTGLEVEAIYKPFASTKIMASYGYLDVEYKEYVTGPVDPVTGFPSESQNRDISDEAATNLYAPENTASLTLEHSFNPWAFGQLTLRASANYTDSINFHPQLTLFNTSKPHTTVNARATLADIAAGQGSFSISLWGKNLTNEEYQDFGIDFGLLGFAENSFADLASYGVDLVYRFNR